MRKLENILYKIKNDDISLEEAKIQVIDLFGIAVSKEQIEETPILVGYLNKVFGFNGYEMVEVGTPVYSFKNSYYFEMTSINGGNVYVQKFHKESIVPFINFINNEK